MNKMVFIGQQPASDDGEAIPIYAGSTGRRLVQMMGVTDEVFAESFIRINVTPQCSADGFNPEDHIAEMNNILPLLEGRRCVLLGPPVAEAFGIKRDQYEFASWFDHPSRHLSMAVIPNPNGRNKLYNNPEMFEMIRSFLDQCWDMR